ncbi:hypothetical protein X975_15779, partial [Stegodyphus mimosarum]
MSNREETIPMLMLNHSDSREDTLPRPGNGTRSESNPRIEPGSIAASSSAAVSQIQPKDQSGSANCTRQPNTS